MSSVIINPFAFGVTDTAPTITSSSTASVAENATLSHTLTANESVTWSIVGGVDLTHFEISGSTLRWVSNSTKDYETPDDADIDHAYVVTVRATDTGSNTADQTITVTVTDVDEGTTFDSGTVSNVTLSNGDRTATHSNTTSNSGARSAHGKTSGKYYFEYLVSDWEGQFDNCGILTAAGTFTNLVTNGTNCATMYGGTGAIWANNASTGVTFTTRADGMVVGWAIDLDNNTVWVRRVDTSGLWNESGTANPATNTGGFSISNYAATTVSPAVGFGGSGTQAGDNVTGRFTAGSLTGTVPSGFTAGWPV